MYVQHQQVASSSVVIGESETDSEDSDETLESQSLSDKIRNNTTHKSGIKSTRDYTPREMKLHRDQQKKLELLKAKEDKELSAALAGIPDTPEYNEQLKKDEQLAYKVAAEIAQPKNKKVDTILGTKKTKKPVPKSALSRTKQKDDGALSTNKSAKAIGKRVSIPTTKQLLLNKLKPPNRKPKRSVERAAAKSARAQSNQT